MRHRIYFLSAKNRTNANYGKPHTLPKGEHEKTEGRENGGQSLSVPSTAKKQETAIKQVSCPATAAAATIE
jgi:hypothetical protein